MERYNYKQAVHDDIRDYIDMNYEQDELIEELQDNRELFEQNLYNDLFVNDSVTGNASGSYYCNAWKAEEALCHNMELLGEALNEFGCDGSYLEKGAETCDVTIRCYLLSQSLSEVLDELEEELLTEENQEEY